MSNVEHFEEDKLKEEKNEPQDSEADALEAVLRHAGDMGLYQKLLFVGMMPFGFFLAWTYFVQMFIAVTPQNHWCRIPELANLSMDIRRNLSAPVSASGNFERCMTYDTNWTEVLVTLKPPSAGTPLIPCQNGWEFDFTDIPYATVVTEREWVCDSASIVPTAQSLFFGGSLVGGFLLGWVADRFGRLPALIASNLIAGIGGVATIFTTGVWDFILCRFIVGMAYDNLYMMLYILVLEYVGAQHRTWVSTMSFAMYFGAGCVSLPWLALWISDWRKLLWVTALPMFIVLLAPVLLPESARWLVSQGQVNKAIKMLRRFERINGRQIPDNVMDEFIISSNKSREGKQDSFMTALRSPLLRRTFIIMVILFMGGSIVFDGLVRLSDSFGMDFFTAFTLSSATEIPSLTLLAIILNRWGRRNLSCIPLTVSGIFVFIAVFVPKGLPQAGLAIAARFFMNMSFTAMIQWVTEILPTGVRASGSSALHISGYAAIMLSPFVVYSERIWSSLPLLIIGVITTVSAGITLWLPETTDQPMPQTVADSERLIREQTLCGKSEQTGEPYKKSAVV